MPDVRQSAVYGLPAGYRRAGVPVYRGRNVIGGTRYPWPAGSYALARKITAGPTGDLLLAVQGYIDQSANNVGQWWAGLWTDDAGTIGRLISTSLTASLYLGGTGGGVGAFPPRWFGSPVGPALLDSNTDYWIGLMIDAGQSGPGIYRDAGGHDRSLNQGGSYASDGERWAQTDTTYDLSIRALVTPL